MNGEAYWLAAVALTDLHPGTQFREMLGHDSLKSQLERLYFTDDFRDMELMGWNTFCLRMEEAGQNKWLAKIRALDSEVVLNHLEQQLMQASRDGKAPNRALLEATVKALQGVSAVSKITTEAESAGGAPSIDIKFIPSLNRPIEPEEWEKILSEKDPGLLKYFGISQVVSKKEEEVDG